MDPLPATPPAPIIPAGSFSHPPKSPRSHKTVIAVSAGVLLLVVAAGLGIYYFLHGSFPVVIPRQEVLGMPGTLRIIETKYPEDSVIIAKYVVTEAPYNADPTGATDATAAFQKAMDDTAKDGGGTVFVPEGTYRFDGALHVPPSVTLRGDWKEPTDADKSVGGSILAIYDTKDSFIALASNSGVGDLTFWYPNQTITNPTAYPTTVIADPHQDSWDHINVRNSTFVNSWEMIDTQPPAGSGNAGKKQQSTGGTAYIKGMYLYNVYGAALHEGMNLYITASVCRAEEIHLGATYWSNSGLRGAPAYHDIATYTQKNATGIIFADNWGTYNLSLEDFATGIESDLRDTANVVTGQEFIGIVITGAHEGIHVTNGNVFLVGASIDATAGENPVGIGIDPGAGATALLLGESTVSSGGIGIDNESPHYDVQVSGSTFPAWNGYAIKSVGGDVIIEGSHFSGSGKDISLGASVTNARIMANTVNGDMSLDSQASADRTYIDNRPLSYPALSLASYPASGIGTKLSIPPQPLPAKTDTHSLYDVSAYGAQPDCTSNNFDDHGKYTGGCTDNTQAFQQALDAAGKAGGGTVYAPGNLGASRGGYYFAGHLHVPTGVELTASPQDGVFTMDSTDAGFIVTGDSSPFITLAASAGVRGLAIWYANQNGYSPVHFAPTIQGQGKNDWIVNTNIAAAWDAVDFGSYDTSGHYLNRVAAHGLEYSFYVSKSSNGFMADVGSGIQNWLKVPEDTTLVEYPQNAGSPPGDLYGNVYNGYNCASGIASKDKSVDTSVGECADLYKTGVGIILGSAQNEFILNSYVHGPHEGLKAVADNGRGPSFTLVHFGSETFTGLDIQALAPAGAKVIETQYHTISTNCYPQNCGDVAGSPYLIVGSGVPATTPLTFYTYANHSFTPIGFDLSGGRTIITQYYSDLQDADAASVKTAVAVHGPQTAFGLIGAKFINPFGGNFVTNDSSPNVVVASIILPGNNPLSGSADVTRMGPATTPIVFGKGGRRKK